MCYSHLMHLQPNTSHSTSSSLLRFHQAHTTKRHVHRIKQAILSRFTGQTSCIRQYTVHFRFSEQEIKKSPKRKCAKKICCQLMSKGLSNLLSWCYCIKVIALFLPFYILEEENSPSILFRIHRISSIRCFSIIYFASHTKNHQ